MSDEIRQSQEMVEVVTPLEVEVRESQNLVEVATPLEVEVRQSQEMVEVAGPLEVEVRETQNVVEVISGLADLSGLYFISPGKTHDSYYLDTEQRIPDPTIRTALIGE